MKTAFITGASRGIGLEVALELSRRGYHVFLTGRDIFALNDTQILIEKNSGTADIVKLDLLDVNSIKSAASVLCSKIDHLDILANIAGMYHDERKHFFDIPFADYPDDAIIKNINAILIGHILLTKYLVPLMDKNTSIINMSGSFDEGETGVISDFITKKSMEIFTTQLPLELKDIGVRANAIRPGFVFTESVQKFFPDLKAEEALDPKDVALRIVEVAENKSLKGEIIDIKK